MQSFLGGVPPPSLGAARLCNPLKWEGLLMDLRCVSRSSPRGRSGSGPGSRGVRTGNRTCPPDAFSPQAWTERPSPANHDQRGAPARARPLRARAQTRAASAVRIGASESAQVRFRVLTPAASLAPGRRASQRPNIRNPIFGRLTSGGGGAPLERAPMISKAWERSPMSARHVTCPLSMRVSAVAFERRSNGVRA